MLANSESKNSAPRQLRSGFLILPLVLSIGPAACVASMIDGTIIRSFPSPLGVHTYGIGMDLDGVHAWVNNRGSGNYFTQIDLFGAEVPGTRGATALAQGFEMTSDGSLWFCDRAHDDAVQMTTGGVELARFNAVGNADDLTLRDGSIWMVNKDGTSDMHGFEPDGTVLGVVQIDGLVGSFTDTEAITYDGTNFWVAAADPASTTECMIYEVTQVGTVMNSFRIGSRVHGLTYDPASGHLLATSGPWEEMIYVIAVPEPSTLIFFGGGLAALGWTRRRR
ncbi:MAG: PEP-CTERM sorting domain-containing protein [bacterium]|nr:PEP-CTERM sorting domain-containing protein [bacterium]